MIRSCASIGGVEILGVLTNRLSRIVARDEPEPLPSGRLRHDDQRALSHGGD